MERNKIESFKVFVSHGSNDSWLAKQIAKEIRDLGAVPFLDESDIPKGAPDFKAIIRRELAESRELVALFTPWSVLRSWVWVEMGAAWNLEIPIIGVFYGLSPKDLDRTGQGKALLEDINVLNLNEFSAYLSQLEVRVTEVQL